MVRAGTYAEWVTLIPPVARVLMADPAAASRPTLRGLALQTDRSNDKRMTVVGIHVTGGVQIPSGPYATLKVFEACSFDSGIGHGPYGSPDPNDVGSILVRNCTIRGEVSLRVGLFTMESDTVAAGGVSLATVNTTCTIRNCWLHGLLIEEMAPGSVTVAGNVIENCQTGIRLSDVTYSVIEDNVVRNCQWGIRVGPARSSIVLNNDVRQCDYGIDVNADTPPIRVNGNTVIGVRWTGIALTTEREVEVRNNVALGCGEAGIRLEHNGGSRRHQITGNTSALNGGAGYDLVVDTPYPYPRPIFEVSNNVGYGNAATGFRWTGPGAPVFGCNDWFANAAGPGSGAAPGSSDLQVDPLFCDIASNDVRLRSDSPLAGDSCGTIGARGIGCAATTAVPTAPPSNREFALGVVRPNPTSGPVSIEYTVPRSAAIDLSVHDLMGREVAHIASGIESEGSHTAHWPGTAHGLRASPGFYFLRFKYPGGQQSRRILLRH